MRRVALIVLAAVFLMAWYKTLPRWCTYLSLTNLVFLVCNVSYGPSFFPVDLRPKQEARRP